jgi:hypothetical protein
MGWRREFSVKFLVFSAGVGAIVVDPEKRREFPNWTGIG